ncbi:jg26306, partial [Pararge aegeria aegeria]
APLAAPLAAPLKHASATQHARAARAMPLATYTPDRGASHFHTFTLSLRLANRNEPHRDKVSFAEAPRTSLLGAPADY